MRAVAALMAACASSNCTRSRSSLSAVTSCGWPRSRWRLWRWPVRAGTAGITGRARSWPMRSVWRLRPSLPHQHYQHQHQHQRHRYLHQRHNYQHLRQWPQLCRRRHRRRRWRKLHTARPPKRHLPLCLSLRQQPVARTQRQPKRWRPARGLQVLPVVTRKWVKLAPSRII